MTESGSTPVEIPPYHQMLWPTLQAIAQLGNSGSNSEIEDKATEIAGYTPDQLAVLHLEGPQTEIRYRMAWARTYLKAVGALENSSRGVWSLTDYGQGLHEGDMAAIPARVRVMTREARNSSASLLSPPDDTKSSTSPPTGAVTSTIYEEWRDGLLSVLQSVSPASFESLCQRVLRESGFTQVQVTGRSGDGGIDGIGVLRVALLSFHVLFQCKRYKGSVGAGDIRDFRGAMVGRTDKGLFITTGIFTAEAKREATRDGAPVIDLIDGDALCNLLKSLNLGVSTRQVEEVSIEPEWFRSI
jgi:restriction system protein